MSSSNTSFLQGAANPDGIQFRSRRAVPNVLVVGKAGVGKSTLCNHLLFGTASPKEGFKPRNDNKTTTIQCSRIEVPSTPGSGFWVKPGGAMAAIDTPGLPHTGGHTLAFYDGIVEMTRETGALNAFILMVWANVDRGKALEEFKTYKMLWEQFNKLPCTRFLVCRFKMPWMNQEAEECRVKEWLASILHESGLNVARTVILKQDSSWSNEIRKLRAEILHLPTMRIGTWGIRKYGEITLSLSRLVDDRTRRHALKVKSRKMQEEHNGLMVAMRRMPEAVPASETWAPAFSEDMEWNKSDNLRKMQSIEGEMAVIFNDRADGDTGGDTRHEAEALKELEKLERIDCHQKGRDLMGAWTDGYDNISID